MSVTQEGAFQAQVKNVEIIEPRFQDMPPESFELKFDLQLANGETGETYLEVSTRMGKGNMSDRSQVQITMETLEKLGWTHGMDFSKVTTFIGKVINVTVKKSANGKYMNIYLNGGFADKPLPAAELARRVALLTGQAQQQQGFAQGGQAQQVFGGQPAQMTPFPQQGGAGFVQNSAGFQQQFGQPTQQTAQVFQQQVPVDPFAAGRMAPAPQFQR
jgi:hypothetical protein